MKKILLALFAVFVIPLQGALAQNSLTVSGRFYAPNPCELMGTTGGVCIQMAVPLSVDFSLVSLGSKTKRSAALIRGKSSFSGDFSLTIPSGRYMLVVHSVQYRLGNGVQTATHLVPSKSFFTFKSKTNKRMTIMMLSASEPVKIA